MSPRLAPSIVLALAASACATAVRVNEVQSPYDVGVERAPAVPPDTMRIGVVADTGKDSAVQRQIAASMRRVCDGRCDFTVFMGDNLYEEGIRPDHEAEDGDRLACLLGRYPEGPKFLALGNHDYHPAFPDVERARAQLKFLAEPGDDLFGGFHFYRFETSLASFFAVDSNFLVRTGAAWEDDARITGFGASIAEADTPWIIAFGHHPLRSNGSHGNAGAYREGDRFRLWSGKQFRRFMLRYVVPHAHLYLAGHDHNLQFYGGLYGTDMAQAISGAGSKCHERSAEPQNEALMERYGNGFAIVEATAQRLTVRYHRPDGEPFFAASRGRRSSWRPLPPWGRSVDPADHCASDAAEAERVAPADGSDCGW